MFEQYLIETQRIAESVQSLFERHHYISAVLFFFIGWFFASFFSKKMVSALEKTKIDALVKRTGWQEKIAKKNINLDTPKILGWIVKWSILIFVLMVSTDILGLQQVSELFLVMINFLPNIFLALLFFFIALFAENFSRKIIIGNVEEEKLVYSKILGEVIRSSIWILAGLAIMYQLQIAQALVLSIFIAILATLALAIGISFGLGGKDLAKKILDEIKNKIS
jgi:hypothetical protein